MRDVLTPEAAKLAATPAARISNALNTLELPGLHRTSEVALTIAFNKSNSQYSCEKISSSGAIRGSRPLETASAEPPSELCCLSASPSICAVTAFFRRSQGTSLQGVDRARSSGREHMLFAAKRAEVSMRSAPPQPTTARLMRRELPSGKAFEFEVRFIPPSDFWG